jgi:hypothetical protein
MKRKESRRGERYNCRVSKQLKVGVNKGITRMVA